MLGRRFNGLVLGSTTRPQYGHGARETYTGPGDITEPPMGLPPERKRQGTTLHYDAQASDRARGLVDQAIIPVVPTA